MRNVREKLISLLGLCSNDYDESTRLQLLTNITLSADYTTLSKSPALKQPFGELYAQAILDGLSNDELEQREALLHKLVSFNNQLVKCIQSGNGPELSPDVKPDFTSLKSITKLCNTIRLSHEKTNYTNIPEELALSIFADSTVRSAQECFNMLPVSVAKSEVIGEDIIKQRLGSRLFCVNIEELERCHQEFLGVADRSESIIAREKVRRRKHRLFKISVIMLCFGEIFACSQFGLVSSSFMPFFMVVMLIVAILFLIWG